MSTETCENCKRIIGELEQAYIWQNHILCKECYARLSSTTGLKPIHLDVHKSATSSKPKRSLVKSTLIVMATIVTVIIVISFALSIPLVTISSYNAKKNELKNELVVSTKTWLKILHSSIIQFKFDTGRYPTEDEGLRVLLERPNDVTGWAEGGYLDSNSIPKDAWENDFLYQLYPENGKPFVIISYGADGKEGGEDYNADLYSTDAE